jgi:RNA polymerase sigma factor CnrH
MIKMMSSLSDLDQMIQAGQSQSQRFAETLVSQYYDYIYRLAVTILGEADEADDICQETFIAALQSIQRYSPGTNLKAWISKIALHKCRQLQRKRWIRDSFLRRIRSEEALQSKPLAPLEIEIEREGSAQIWKAIHALGEKHRIPVLLYYVYELKIREIADILNLPQGTVSSRLHYAIRKLEKVLK